MSDCSRCKAHGYFHGGIMDGHVKHKVYNTPSDFPASIGTLLRHGQRSWYRRDDAASTATEYVYRFVCISREMPAELREGTR